MLVRRMPLDRALLRGAEPDHDHRGFLTWAADARVTREQTSTLNPTFPANADRLDFSAKPEIVVEPLESTYPDLEDITSKIT